MNLLLLEAKDLSKRYPLQGSPFARAHGWIEAVREVSLSVAAGECVGVVGESGCGKSTLARLLCGLIPPTSGRVLLHTRPQIIFQDPMSSLDPLMRVGAIVSEPLQIHRATRGKELRRKVEQLLSEVGLEPAFAGRFPAALSGGQRQRVGIARALALDPGLLICDEPVSSLDLSVQAQILKLLAKLQAGRRLSLLLISHDLSVVGALSDRILVMREGRIIEEGANPHLFQAPKDPYTRQLVNLAVPPL